MFSAATDETPVKLLHIVLDVATNHHIEFSRGLLDQRHATRNINRVVTATDKWGVALNRKATHSADTRPCTAFSSFRLLGIS